MNFRSFSYTIMEAFRGLIKNRLMSAASIITLSSCLFMVSISFCLAVNLDYLLIQMESMMSITVYLEDGMSTEEVNDLIGRVNQIPFVTQLEFISSGEALERFKVDLEDSAHILDGLDKDNPLPNSLVLDIDSLSHWDYVENNLNELKEYGVETIQHGRQAANALMTVNNLLRVVGALVIAGLGVISVVIIFNTIRIAVNTRKTEINIMKYVGATDAFIRGPFIVEGMIIGIFGAVIPLAGAYALYNPVKDFLINSLPVIDFLFHNQSYVFSLLTPLLFAVGVLIGIVGSTISIRRYLNV
ncbi:MAG: permease-like cell division protein FtsX [Clostridiales bacterium]|jgi:cell division transport system permease protein|nr:permease-like cell division protein FtsX [Clostridiales bacterium]